MSFPLGIVQRIVDNLPSNGTRTFESLEIDESLRQCCDALVELARFDLQEVVAPLFASLERQQSTRSGRKEHVQSETFLARVISACLQCQPKPSVLAETSNGDKTFSDRLALKALTCAMAMIELPSSEVISSPNKAVSRSAKRTMSSPNITTTLSLYTQDLRLQREQQEHAKVIVSFISAVNWPISFNYFSRILSSVDEAEEEYNKKAQALAWLTLTVSRLEGVMSLVCSKIVSLRKSSQCLLAMYFDTAILTWIEHNPHQFHESVIDRRRFSSNSDVIFELVLDLAQEQKRKLHLWPVLSTLLMCFPDEPSDTRKSSRKQFLELLLKSRTGKESVAVFEAHTRILSIASLVSIGGTLYMENTLVEIMGRLSNNLVDLRSYVDQDLFLAKKMLLAMSKLGFHEQVRQILISWLDDRPTSPSRVQAIHVVSELLADDSALENPGLATTLAGIAPRIRELFFTSALAPRVTDRDTRHSSRALGRDLARGLLEVFCFSPALLGAKSISRYITTVVASVMHCLAEEKEATRSLAGKLLQETQKSDCVQGRLFNRPMHSLNAEDFLPVWSSFSSMIIIAIAKRLLATDLDLEHINFLLACLSSALRQRQQTLNLYQGLLATSVFIQEHIAMQITVESSLLVLTCHPDPVISTEAAKSCDLLLQELGLLQEIYKSLGSEQPVLNNNAKLFKALSREVFVTHGRNATQRKITKCLLDGSATPGLADAWLNIYTRWKDITEKFFQCQPSPASVIEDDVRREWLNYTGFLCATGRFKRYAVEAPPVIDFVRTTCQVLNSPDALLRESCAIAIGRELHQSLYGSMLIQMRKLATTMRDSNGVLIVRDRNSSLTENLMLMMKGFFDRIECFLGHKDGSEIGGLMLTFGDYMQSCGISSLRMRYCQLCEAFAQKRDLLCVHNEYELCRSLCNHLARWIPDRTSDTLQERQPRDMHLPCLAAMSILTDGLRLDHDTRDPLPQVFASLQTLLEFCIPLLHKWSHATKESNMESNRMMIMTMLKNTLLSNQASILTPFIQSCHDADPLVQQVFLQLLIDVVVREKSGIRVIKSTLDLLEEVFQRMSSNDWVLPAMLDSCLGGSSFDSLAEALLHLFESHGKTAYQGLRPISARSTLFLLTIRAEISMCDTDGELFRRNSALTRLWNLYIRRYCESYVEETLEGPLTILARRPDDYSMEIDPARESNEEVRLLNLLHLKETCSTFIDGICASAPKLSPTIRELCHIIALVAGSKYPNSVYISIGSFIMLRCLSPAIVNPKNVLITPRLQRQLLLVVKVLTNLANNSFFKETHMTPVNEFLKENIEKLTKFFHLISRPIPKIDQVPTPMVGNIRTPDYLVYHAALVNNGDRFRAAIIESCLKRGQEVGAIRQRILETRRLICALGPPSIKAESGSRGNSLFSANDPEDRLVQFLQHRSAASEHESLISRTFYHSGSSLAGHPVLCLALRDLQSWGQNTGEYWMQDILKVLQLYKDAPYEVFIDATGFMSSSYHTWIDLFFELLPDEAMENCAIIYFYNVSTSFLEYMRSNLLTMIQEARSLRFLSFGDDLTKYLNFSYLSHSMAKINQSEKLISHRDVHHVTSLGHEDEVSLQLSQEHGLLVLRNLSKHELFWSSRVSLTEILDIEDIAEVIASDKTLTLVTTDNRHLILKSDHVQDIAQDIHSILRAISGTKDSPEALALGYLTPDQIRGTLLCASLLRLQSAHVRVRQAAMDLLCVLLTQKDISQIGIHSANPSAGLGFSKLELTTLHIFTLRNESEPQVVLSFFQEALRNVHIIDSITGRSEAIRCLKIWLAAILRLPTHDPVSDAYEEAKMRALLRLMLETHCRMEEDIILDLWAMIQLETLLQEVMYDTIASFAMLFDHESLQVERTSQIIKTVRSTHVDNRLIGDIMNLIRNLQSHELNTLHQGTNWPATQSLLRLLATSLARSSILPTKLPHLMYVAMACLRQGGSDRKYVYYIMKNVAATTLLIDGLSEGQLGTIRTVLSEIVAQKSFYLELERSSSSSPGVNGARTALHNPTDLVNADNLSNFVLQMLTLLRASSTSKEEETRKLAEFSALLAETAFSASPTQRRAFVALGVLATEVKAYGTVQPVLEALSIALRQATHQDSRLAISTILCISNMPNPQGMIWLAIAFCGYPVSSISGAGLRMFLRCLQSLDQDDSGLSVSEVFEAAYKCVSARWARLQRVVQFRTDTSDSSRSFGICCALLQTMRATSGSALEEVKACLVLLIKLHLKRSTLSLPQPISLEVLPFLVFLKCLTGSAQEVISLVSNTGLLSSGFRFSTENDLQSSILHQSEYPDATHSLLLVSLLMNLLRLSDTPPETLRVLQILAEAIDTKIPYVNLVKPELLPILRGILCKSHQISLLKVATRIVVMSRVERKTEAQTPPAGVLSKKAMLEDLGFSFLHQESIEHTTQQLEHYKSSVISIIEHIIDGFAM